MIAQGALPYRIEPTTRKTKLTGMAGLLPYLDLMATSGLIESVRRHVRIRSHGQGFSDEQMVVNLVALNLVGGDCVQDLDILEADEGYCTVVRTAETYGMSRKERRAAARRWRKERERTVPSPSSAFRYLSCFHDAGQEELRQPKVAFIPQPTTPLRGLYRVNADLLAFAQRVHPYSVATLDMDATLQETCKRDALYCYKGFPAFQPMNVYWAETGLMVHSEFRDGNVPAGHEQRRMLEESLGYLPAHVEKVYVRSDTAGYQHELLEYCEKGKSRRFGRIEFAICCDVTAEFRQAALAAPEWHKLYREVDSRRQWTGKEYAEVCYVPHAIAHSKQSPTYRYLAIREVLAQPRLPGVESQQTLPFPVEVFDGRQYKLFGTVTNMDWEAEDLIHWQHARCGKSEEAHAVLKEDLAGGRFPSGEFGENAAWWGMTVLSFNLHILMKSLVLGEEWLSCRMKAVRLALIHLPGQIVCHAKQLVVRVSRRLWTWAQRSAADWLVEIRRRIAHLLPQPAG